MKCFTNYFRIVLVFTIGLVLLSIPAVSQDKKSFRTSNEWHIPEELSDVITIKNDYSEVKDIIPIRGTRYMIRVPNDWNGTLVSDLDYYDSANSVKYLYLLDQGYAIAGTKRRPDRLDNYDPAHEIHDIISVLDIFESSFGKPSRTIQYGCSGGGTITLAIAEIHPDRFDGAIAACASTSPWMANTHLDGLFVLQSLIAPDLPIVDLPLDDPEISEINKAWLKALDDAQKTPEGRARIALAITIGQWPAWGGPGDAYGPEPEPNDIEALQECMYKSFHMLLPSKGMFGTTMLELSGPGQLKSNVGIDYKTLYQNGDEYYMKAVETLYKRANIDLESDLEKINGSPRVAADPAAIKWWSAPGRTHIGKPKIPLLRLQTNGDGLVYPSMVQGYEELVRANGYDDLFRSAYVNRWGHCGFSLAEFLAAMETINERLDTGSWPSTEPEALNELGESLDPDSEAKFYHYRRMKRYNRGWSPSVKDYIGDKVNLKK